MRIVFDPDGWEDFCWWAANDPRIFKRLRRLIEETRRDPTNGPGKPERLSGNLSGFWSRRITEEHRLVYTVQNSDVIIAQARGHY